MKIAFDAKRLFNNFTGLGNYSRTLVKNIHTFYPEVEIHLFTPKVTDNEETRYFLEASNITIHTPSKNYPGWREFGMAREVNRLKPDIFHGLSHELPFGIHASIKTVVTFHDLIYEKFPHQFGTWDRWAYKVKYRSAAQRADHIIAISQNTADDLNNFYSIDRRKISVVYQSCHDVFQNLEAMPDSQKTSFLYVGSIIERKGLLNAVLAYHRLPPENQKPFVVIGSGSGAYVEKVRNMIDYLQLGEKFTFINKVSNSDLRSFYTSAICLVYPSMYEGFGIPLIESLFSKTPVITTESSSLPEAAGPGAIYIKTSDVDDLARAMQQVLDEDCRLTLAEAGNDYVKSHFSSEITTASLMDVYRKLS